MDGCWKIKARRVSPTGLGRISARSDCRLPMCGIGSVERRLSDAHAVGGTLRTHELRLGRFVLHARRSEVEPYGGVVWSWPSAELNRIACVDGRGGLWIARAGGGDPDWLARGSFSAPARSEDGRTLIVPERNDEGRRWEVSVFHHLEKHRR